MGDIISKESGELAIAHFKKPRAIYGSVGMTYTAKDVDIMISCYTAEKQAANGQIIPESWTE